jgi:sensor domain CHASE-containing protein
VLRVFLRNLLYLSIILPSMIQLEPEIYRLIVKALIAPEDEHSSRSSANSKQPLITSHNSAELISRDQQSSLATSMRVSKVSTLLLQLARLISRFFTISAKPNYTEIA